MVAAAASLEDLVLVDALGGFTGTFVVVAFGLGLVLLGLAFGVGFLARTSSSEESEESSESVQDMVAGGCRFLLVCYAWVTQQTELPGKSCGKLKPQAI